jgi:hypothetical protein
MMAVQITGKCGRKQSRMPPQNYLAYFSRYRLEAESAVVRHELHGQLFPDRPSDD